MKLARELINAYNKRFPAIEQFLNQCVMNAKSQGYVETLFGRRRPLPDIHSAIVQLRNAAERMAYQLRRSGHRRRPHQTCDGQHPSTNKG